MATIGASLRLYDQITDTLARAEQGVQSLITAAERLNAVAQRPIEIRVDTGRAMAEIDALESRLADVVGTTQVQVSVGVGDISQQIGQLQQQLRSTLALELTVDTGQVLSQLEPLKEQLVARWGTVSLRVELDQSGLQRGLAALEDVRTAAAAPLVLRADAAAAEAQIDALRSQLASVTSGADIRVTVGAEDMAQEIGRMQQQLRNALASATVEVTLDSGGALQEAARLRSQLEAQVGPVSVQVQLDGAGLQGELQSLLGAAEIKVAAQIDRGGVMADMAALREQLSRSSNPVTLQVSVHPALSMQVSGIRAQISTLMRTATAGQSYAMVIRINPRVVVDTGGISSKVTEALRDIQDATAKVTVSVELDTARALRQATALRTQILSRIGSLDIEITLNSNVTTLLTDLIRLVRDLEAAIRNIPPLPPGGGGGPGPSGGGGGGDIMGSVKGLIAGYMDYLAGSSMLSATVGGAMEQQVLTGQLQVQTGVDEGQAEAMMESVKSVFAQGWGDSLAGVAGDFSLIRQNLSGLSQEASEAFLSAAYAVEKVSAGRTNVEEMSKVTRNLMANFAGLGETEALDLIATGFQRGGDYAGDLMDTVNEYAVHFAGLGMNAEQMFATLIAGSKEGAWNLDRVGDAVKESFIRMQDLSDSSAEAFKALGMDANKMAAQIAAGGDTANQAYQATLLALSNVGSELDRNTIGAKLFGTQWEDLEDSVILAMQAGQQGLEGFEGATQRAADALQNNIGYQLEQLKRNFSLGMAEAGEGAVQGLMPLILMINEAFQAGKFQPFFDGLANGLATAADWVRILYEAIVPVYDFFVSSWSMIAPVIEGAAAALAAFVVISRAYAIQQAIAAFATGTSTAAIFLQTLATSGLAAAWGTLNKAMKANVIIFIVSAIIGLVIWIYQLWKTNDNFVAGFMRAWNAVLNFFDKIPAYFWQLVEWLLDPFVWWAEKVGGVYDTVINGIIDGINSVLTVINKLTGSSYEIAAKFKFEDIAKGMKEYAQVKKEEAYAAAAKKAAEREQNVQDMLKDREAARKKEEEDQKAKDAANGAGAAAAAAAAGGGAATGAGAGANIDKIDKVGELGKIKDTVDISSEDLKTMRDLAEMNAIQNFVTLTPTVNITTGDIKNGVDLDTMIDKINEELLKEIEANSKGVYDSGG